MCSVCRINTQACIVRRLPVSNSLTDMVVPFGAGIIFFPLTFLFQDVAAKCMDLVVPDIWSGWQSS